MGFRAWSCGHNHQADAEGRTATCGDANWFVIENDGDQGYINDDGLLPGDYTLHTQRADGTFSPAHWGQATARAKQVAANDGRRLMVRNAAGDWVEVP